MLCSGSISEIYNKKAIIINQTAKTNMISSIMPFREPVIVSGLVISSTLID